ncbi:MAG: nuclear transport factor 2 family protein [Gammaproteobacteria bacterium]|nr:nuclear transport factor 2 family protein [Gammaproteobacteria bacterium]
MSEQNEQLVRDFFAALSSGDLEQVRPLFHPEAIWQVMPKNIPGEGIHRGRDYICDEFLAPVRGLFEPGDPKVIVDTCIGKGNIVACETRGVGKLLNGKVYDNIYAWFFEIRDGKVFHLREYMDSLYVTTLV